MRPLSTAELISCWDTGLRLGRERAVALLAEAAFTEDVAGGAGDAARTLDPAPGPGLARDVPLAERDARLLDLRARMFGRTVTATTACPSCGERVEITMDLGERRAEPAAAVMMVRAEGYEVEVRGPTVGDWAEARRCQEVGEAERLLLARCVRSAKRGGEAVGPDELPAAVVRAVEARLEEADGAAGSAMTVECPACGGSWRASLDVAEFLWAELDFWARRTLRDVHDLASSYGWREADILAMSPARRRVYVEMVTR